MPNRLTLTIFVAILSSFVVYGYINLVGKICRIPNVMNIPGLADILPVMAGSIVAAIMMKTLTFWLRSRDAPFGVRLILQLTGTLTIIVFAKPFIDLADAICLDIEK